MVGAGALAPYLIAAHRIVRPSIERVIVWNRNPDKARILAEKLQEEESEAGKGVTFTYSETLDEVIALGDVVSCATSSEIPIVQGEKLKPGAHLDLVGSFTPTMRECDDGALARGRVFVDFEVAMEEAGELVSAFERGVISPADVAGTLVELVGGTTAGRMSDDEVTVFKSVGTAVVDLLAAQLAYENSLKGSCFAVQFCVLSIYTQWSILSATCSVDMLNYPTFFTSFNLVLEILQVSVVFLQSYKVILVTSAQSECQNFYAW